MCCLKFRILQYLNFIHSSHYILRRLFRCCGQSKLRNYTCHFWARFLPFYLILNADWFLLQNYLSLFTQNFTLLRKKKKNDIAISSPLLEKILATLTPPLAACLWKKNYSRLQAVRLIWITVLKLQWFYNVFWTVDKFSSNKPCVNYVVIHTFIYFMFIVISNLHFHFMFTST